MKNKQINKEVNNQNREQKITRRKEKNFNQPFHELNEKGTRIFISSACLNKIKTPYSMINLLLCLIVLSTKCQFGRFN